MSSDAYYLDLSKVEFTPALLMCVPKHLARKYRVLPVSMGPDYLCIAMVHPSDFDAIDALTHILKREIRIRVIDEAQFDTFYRRLYVDSNVDTGR